MLETKYTPTPTQKRLLDDLALKGTIQVRVTFPQPKGQPRGEMMNAYELRQLEDLEMRGYCKIVNRKEWKFESELTGATLHGQTFTALPQ
jgi:hypothetical protein